MNPTSNNTSPIFCGGPKDISYPVKELSPASSPLNKIHSKLNSPLLKGIEEIKTSVNDKASFERQEVPEEAPKKKSLLKF